MQYMEAVKGDEDPGFSCSDEEEDGDHSGDEETVASERDATEERGGPDTGASAEDHGLGDTARGSNLGPRGQKEIAIPRPISVDNPLEEDVRPNTGSGAPQFSRDVSVETGLRTLKVSAGGVPEKGV